MKKAQSRNHLAENLFHYSKLK